MPVVTRIILSYRESGHQAGGEVSTQPALMDLAGKPLDESVLEQAQHIVLLIHGYNNDTNAARKAYEGFHARQRDLDAGERYGIGRTFVEVYWPGDAAWGIASFLFYMGSIKHAIQTAERLAGYLATHARNAVRVDIVAHSMGCRLGLELLRALENQQASLSLERIVFMAAAAPTFMLEQRSPSRRLRPAYDRVLREGARSLYSGSDMVLAFAFPAGQSLAPGVEGFLPTALGHAKWTDATVPHNLDQQENPKANHGDYWGWNQKAGPLQCALKAAQEVRSYLQFPSAGSRTMSERLLAESPVPDARPTEAREVIVRNLPAYG